MKALLVAIFLALYSSPAVADDLSIQRYLSAAFILDASKDKPSEPDFRRGLCVGQMQMLYLLAFGDYLGSKARFCPPDGVTIDQTRKVVIKYIEDRPEQLHSPFLFLAIDALRKAWPCPKS